MTAFYVDSCIYINLLKKEIGRQGQPFWKFADDFFKKIGLEEDVIFFSACVMQELKFILGKRFFEKKKALFQHEWFKKVHATREDYANARGLESESQFTISFFDCMHITLARKYAVMLITRDRKLIDFARTRCAVARPEEIKDRQALY